MPRYNRDSSGSNKFSEYKAPLGTLNVADIGDKGWVSIKNRVSPLVMARVFKQLIDDVGAEEGHVSAKGMPSINFDVIGSNSIKVMLKIHEVNVENEFSFRSHYSVSGRPEPPTVTSATDLGGSAGEAASLFESAFDMEFEFTKLDGASIGGMGNIVDFEFDYEGFTSEGTVGRSKPGEYV